MRKTVYTLALFALAALVAMSADAQGMRSLGRRGGGGLLGGGFNRGGGMMGNRPMGGSMTRQMPGINAAPAGGAQGGAAMGGGGAAMGGGMMGEDGRTPEEILADIPKGTNGVPTRLSFDQAPLELLVYAYADVADKIPLFAPNLPKTQVTLKTFEDRELTKEQYLNAIERVLTMNGVVLEEVDDIFLYALDRKTVRTAGIRTSMEIPTNAIPEKGRVVSQLIRLTHITADEAQKAIEGFKDPTGLFQVFERNNTILVTDTQENVNRMLEIIKQLDQANPVLEDVFVRQIKFAMSTDIKTALETIVTESQKDAQLAASGPKTSGAPGFASRTQPQPQTQPTRLLNINNRPQTPQTPQPATPNATILAQVSDADRGMIRGKVLILADERSNKLIVITAKTNMDFFDKVIETLDVETTPEVSVEVVRLKYADAEEVASMLNDLIGNGSSASQRGNNQNPNARNGQARNLTQSNNRTGGFQQPGTWQSQQQRAQTAQPTFSSTASSSLGELNRDNIKILADKRINGIVMMARKADMKAVKEVIDDMDVKLSQVLIETVIVQVELGDDLTTGVDWVQRGKYRTHQQVQRTDSFGRPLFYAQDSDGNLLRTLVPEGYSGTDASGNAISASATAAYKTITKTLRNTLFNNGSATTGSMLGGGGGSASGTLQNLVGLGATAGSGSSSDDDTAETIANTAALASGTLNPIGGGINYILKSDKLNIGAVLQACKGDSRTKVLASPILMTVDNKEATIEATDMIYLFSGYQYSGSSYSGTQVRNYEKRDIGLTVKVTPRINPNGTVVLTVEQTFETQGADQNVPNESGGTDPYATVTTRKISSDVSVENRMTVVMGGLQKKTLAESETGIPILKDIPWIGKWLFSSTSTSEKRSELLVFMTPYVLDDADAAQTEAIRRKKALSDPRPFEANGWSLSPAADPISKKEQLRRLNEEWARQDEERKTAKALEEAREARAKRLAEMDESERKEWAEKHQKEILEEQKLFDKNQKDLRAIIDQIREKHGPVEERPEPEPGNAPQPAELVPAVRPAPVAAQPMTLEQLLSDQEKDEIPVVPAEAPKAAEPAVAGVEALVVEAKPAETVAPVVEAPKPAEAKPAEAKPAETVAPVVEAPKPAEVKPAETVAPVVEAPQPVAAKPAEVKPAAAKPVAEKPAEVKPAAAKPVAEKKADDVVEPVIEELMDAPKPAEDAKKKE